MATDPVPERAVSGDHRPFSLGLSDAPEGEREGRKEEEQEEGRSSGERMKQGTEEGREGGRKRGGGREGGRREVVSKKLVEEQETAAHWGGCVPFWEEEEVDCRKT